MANREPFDDDLLDSITGGTSLNEDVCPSYAFNGCGSQDNTCNTCIRKGTPLCPYGK